MKASAISAAGAARALLVALLPALCALADAAPFAVAAASDGTTVTLHDESGPCLRAARLAVWMSADRSESISGCWVMVPGYVLVSFFDGERGNIPVAHLRRLRSS